ncbi:MAG: cytochrome C [Hyphomicrobiaceae bacterium]|nr:cytochrome C [Hyphomicrobiaceae bacterium]
MLYRFFLSSLPLFILAMLAMMQPAHSQSLFERMVMPGPLIHGHAKFEKKCSNCHENFNKSSQAGLCLACHKKVASDLKSKTGFHGKRKDISATRCKHCHTDHKGRKMDIIGLDQDAFNHALTDFALKGAHRVAECSSCHETGKKHRDAPGQCVACHEKQEPHQGRLGKKCQLCHSEEKWRTIKPYNHDKTKFPLLDSHKKVRCQACHINERYKDLPTTCISCHALQDVHNGQLGNRCETCHKPDKWKSVIFDHDKNTRFPLRGKHKKAACKNCHKKGAGDISKQPQPQQSWAPLSPVKMKKPRSCYACHKKEDVHKGQLGKDCAKCHNPKGWRKDLSFDHDLTRFPLIGLHSVVPCEECHVTQSFRKTSRQCANCHKDTHHKGRLRAECSLCHNPNSWQLWIFDHNRQTNAPLNGAHKQLECHACHKKKNPKKGRSIKFCARCHTKDDVHGGKFGSRCGRCHLETDFKSLKIR